MPFKACPSCHVVVDMEALPKTADGHYKPVKNSPGKLKAGPQEKRTCPVCGSPIERYIGGIAVSSTFDDRAETEIGEAPEPEIPPE